MKQYFMIVYGGMTIIAIGMGISYGGAMVWNGIRASRIDLHISKALSSTVSNARASVISVFSDVILSSSDN
ncbi:MAG: hypothetical protein NTZ38_01595, partial [Candidatus Taylorbacteria bacterium]|nr:hypothetical protein [Candidatus Taylorbacteria bacterium]